MERAVLQSNGTEVVGYWHWPKNSQGPSPAIVMGHGFGAEWTFGTAETIADFVNAGFAVFTFDYRHFGESAGEPRQLVSPKRQLADWHSVLAFVRLSDRIDRTRLAIWGSSMGGGHVLSVAARDRGLAAAVAQVPHCNAFDAAKNVPVSIVLRMTGHALYDALFGLFGGVHRIPLFESPDKVGAMTFPGWKKEGLKLRPEDSHWVNALPARSMLSVVLYSPENRAGQIKCPVCVHYAKRDRGVPPKSVVRTAGKIPRVELHHFEGDHFDVYHGERRKQLTQDQIAFLGKHMPAQS